MPKLQLEEKIEGGNDCEQKEKSLQALFKLFTTHHFCP